VQGRAANDASRDLPRLVIDLGEIERINLRLTAGPAM
jgi:hypothetical protein